MHSVTQFHNCNVTANAKSVGGSTPGVRVTWETTVPTGGIKSVRVEFRTTIYRDAVKRGIWNNGIAE